MKDKIMAVLEQAVENGDAAGANVLVIHNGKEAVYCGYGMRDMETVSYTHLTLPTKLEV